MLYFRGERILLYQIVFRLRFLNDILLKTNLASTECHKNLEKAEAGIKQASACIKITSLFQNKTRYFGCTSTSCVLHFKDKLFFVDLRLVS